MWAPPLEMGTAVCCSGSVSVVSRPSRPAGLIVAAGGCGALQGAMWVPPLEVSVTAKSVEGDGAGVDALAVLR